ncbi:hypothetical protein [Roseimaritima ulvae]|nr:hypothetical protein [Roseimaritima ulvae]
MAHFRLVLGRLELDPPRHRKGTKAARQELPFPLSETLTVSSRRGVPSLHYTFQTDQQHVIVDVVDAQRVQILSHRVDRQQRVTLTQPVSGPLEIQLDHPSDKQSFQSPSLIHLRASHPVLFETHLHHLMPYLLDGPTLETITAAAEQRLLRVACERPIPSLDDVRDALDRIRSPQSKVRRAAEAELLAMGLPVLRHLDRLDNEFLDAEQRSRIRRVRWTLRPQQSDSPSRLASWLSTDRDYWNLAAVHWSPAQRVLADQYVQRVCGIGLDAEVLDIDEGIRIAEAAAPFSR